MNWISGFVTGQGNFDVKISEQSTNKIGFRVQLRFRISQHPRGRRARRSREREIKIIKLLNKIFRFSPTEKII